MFLFVIPIVTWESVELLEMKYKKRKSTQSNFIVYKSLLIGELWKRSLKKPQKTSLQSFIDVFS